MKAGEFADRPAEGPDNGLDGMASEHNVRQHLGSRTDQSKSGPWRRARFRALSWKPGVCRKGHLATQDRRASGHK